MDLSVARVRSKRSGASSCQHHMRSVGGCTQLREALLPRAHRPTANRAVCRAARCAHAVDKFEPEKKKMSDESSPDASARPQGRPPSFGHSMICFRGPVQGVCVRVRVRIIAPGAYDYCDMPVSATGTLWAALCGSRGSGAGLWVPSPGNHPFCAPSGPCTSPAGC